MVSKHLQKKMHFAYNKWLVDAAMALRTLSRTFHSLKDYPDMGNIFYHIPSFVFLLHICFYGKIMKKGLTEFTLQQFSPLCFRFQQQEKRSLDCHQDHA